MTHSWLWLLALSPAALLLLGLAPSALAERRRSFVLAATHWLSLAVLGSALLAALLVMAFGGMHTGTLGLPGLGLALHVDALSAVMFVLVGFIGVIVVQYSHRYMDGDPGQGRFTARLAFTLGAVLFVILAGNLVHFALAWFALSAGLHRLLLFYPHRPAAVLAARKKFLASRLGDATLLGAMVLLWSSFGSLDYSVLFAQAPALVADNGMPGSLHAVAALLVVTALLKSAQFPLHGWLIEVMETPTPVSALLHAGIINAGGYLILRFADIIALSVPALEMMAVVGGFTALFASLVMLTQTSIKVSLAWSTIAQMGFMLLQCGLGAFSAALLHILAHSCYKAHAFLSSGSVIDIVRAAWTPGPGGQPHPARMVLAIVLVVVIALAVGALFGATPATQPGVLTLGTVLLLGIVHLIANAIDVKADWRVILRTIAIAIGVSAAWFALQLGAAWLFSGALPANLPADGPIDMVISAIVILSFAALTIFQSRLPHQSATPAWQRFHVHVWNGFYVNTLINRAIVQRWPSPPDTRSIPGRPGLTSMGQADAASASRTDDVTRGARS